MVDNNFLMSETSNLRKIINDLENLFRQYSASPPDYLLGQNKAIRNEIATKFDSKSRDLKDSLFKIGRELSENKKYLSRSDKNDLVQIEKLIRRVETSILFHVGLKENDNWDYDRINKMFEDTGTGISSVKLQVEWIISMIRSLSFEPIKHPEVLEDDILQKIKEWVIKNAIYWIIAIIFMFIISILFGIKPKWL